MSSLNSVYIKKETLETLLKGVNSKGEKGIELTVSINDDANQFGQNLSAFVSQSKEDREAKKSKFYVGNGNTFWTDGSIQVVKKEKAEAPTQAKATAEVDDDLPF
jgi:hypothetical protein